MVGSKPAEQDEELEPLSQEERDSLARALRDYRAGRVTPHEEIAKRLRRLDRKSDAGEA